MTFLHVDIGILLDITDSGGQTGQIYIKCPQL